MVVKVEGGDDGGQGRRCEVVTVVVKVVMVVMVGVSISMELKSHGDLPYSVIDAGTEGVQMNLKNSVE